MVKQTNWRHHRHLLYNGPIIYQTYSTARAIAAPKTYSHLASLQTLGVKGCLRTLTHKRIKSITINIKNIYYVIKRNQTVDTGSQPQELPSVE